MSTLRYSKPHYFSIEELLVTEETIPCTFIQTKRCIGFLELELKHVNVTAGTSFQLPYWIADCLLPHANTVNINLPRVYNELYRDVLRADAKVVDLRKASKFYYLLGKYLAKLKVNESDEIKLMLRETFKQRFRMILDWSQNNCTDLAVTKRLDRFESFVFECNKLSQNRLDSWLKIGADTMKTTSVVVGCKKKKLGSDTFL